MAKKLILLGILIIAFIVVLELVKGFGGKSLVGGGATSPNILYLTQPVYSFSGKVERVSGDSIMVSQEIVLATAGGPAGAIGAPAGAGGPAAGGPAGAVKPVTPTPTPKPRKISYTITVGKNTLISRPSNSVPYLLKTQQIPAAGALGPVAAGAAAGANQSKLTTKDVEENSYISVNANVDLRTLRGDRFEATSINLPQLQTSISGKIVDVRGTTVRVKAFVGGGALGPAMAGPAGAQSQEKEFDVIITKDTEISRSVPTTDISKPPKPEEVGVSDLKKDMQVTVYTDVDVSKTTRFTALLINPAAPIIAPPAASAGAPAPAGPAAGDLEATKSAIVSPTATSVPSPTTAPTRAATPTTSQ